MGVGESSPLVKFSPLSFTSSAPTSLSLPTRPPTLPTQCDSISYQKFVDPRCDSRQLLSAQSTVPTRQDRLVRSASVVWIGLFQGSKIREGTLHNVPLGPKNGRYMPQWLRRLWRALSFKRPLLSLGPGFTYWRVLTIVVIYMCLVVRSDSWFDSIYSVNQFRSIFFNWFVPFNHSLGFVYKVCKLLTVCTLYGGIIHLVFLA